MPMAEPGTTDGDTGEGTAARYGSTRDLEGQTGRATPPPSGAGRSASTPWSEARGSGDHSTVVPTQPTPRQVAPGRRACEPSQKARSLDRVLEACGISQKWVPAVQHP